MKKIKILWRRKGIMKLIKFIILFFISSSFLSAQQWEDAVRMTNTGSSGLTWNTQIGTVGDTVHYIWSDGRNSVSMQRIDVYYKRSSDAGETWDDDINLTNFPNDNMLAFSSCIEVDGQNLYVVFENYISGFTQLYFIRSTNGGNSWEEPTLLIDYSQVSGNVEHPNIVSFGSIVHVVYRANQSANEPGKLYYLRSNDYGVSWSEPVHLASPPSITGQSWHIRNNSHITISGDKLYVTYSARTLTGMGETKAALIKSVDGGLNWGQPHYFAESEPGKDIQYINTVKTGSVLHAVLSYWSLSSGMEGHSYYIRSNDEGLNWQDSTQLDNNAPDHAILYPSITVSGNNMYITNTQDYMFNSEIICNTSTDNGITWQPVVIVDTVVVEVKKMWPHIAATNGKLHLIWSDNRDDEWSNEIYYCCADIPTVGIENNEIIKSFELLQNYPNPFRDETTISFGLKNQTKITIEVFNITGQKVKTLLNKKMQAGNHEINWNGCNETGDLLTNGFYFYKLETGIHSQTQKMLLIR
jgi:hypothetical protein